MRQSPMSDRVVPLRRGGPPARRTGLQPVSFLDAPVAGRRRPDRSGPPGEFSAEFSPAVRAAVRLRAGFCCECCGTWLGETGGEIQHIVARKYGGRGPKAPQWIREIVNAALLCGPFTISRSCHQRAEARDEDMGPGDGGKGFWLREIRVPGWSPAQVPMFHWQAGWVWRTPQGGYSASPPAGDAG